MPNKKKFKIYIVGQLELSEAGKQYVREKMLPALKRTGLIEILRDTPVSTKDIKKFMEKGDLRVVSRMAKESFLSRQKNLEKADMVLAFIHGEEGSCPDPETAWTIGATYARKKRCLGCRDNLSHESPAITDSIAFSCSQGIVRSFGQVVPYLKSLLRLCGIPLKNLKE